MSNNIERTIDFYNSERERYQKNSQDKKVEDFVISDPSCISWTRALRNYVRRNLHIQYSKEKLNVGLYRPFQKQHIYFTSELIESIGLSPKFFPTPKHKNLVICVSGIGASKDFSALIVNMVPCYDMLEKSQCFPLLRRLWSI